MPPGSARWVARIARAHAEIQAETLAGELSQLIGTSSTGSSSGNMSDTRMTDAGGAENFAHRIRVPGPDAVSGLRLVQRHAPSEVKSTGYFRLWAKSKRAIRSTAPPPGNALFLIS